MWLASLLLAVVLAVAPAPSGPLKFFPMSRAQLAQDQKYITAINPRYQLFNGYTITPCDKSVCVTLDVVIARYKGERGSHRQFVLFKFKGTVKVYEAGVFPGEVKELEREDT